MYLTASLFFSTIKNGPALEGFSSLGNSSANSSPAMAVAERQIVPTNCKLASHMCCMPKRQQTSLCRGCDNRIARYYAQMGDCSRVICPGCCRDA